VRLALDSNRYSDFCRGVPEATDRVRKARELAVPLIVLAELRGGFRAGSRAEENERTLTRFLQSRRVRVLLPDDTTTHFYARIFAQLKQAGTPVPANDIWIAALVLQHGLILFTRDHHFRMVPGLALI
jgi:tRNA(fMet)-specific endonuclease VapC